MEIAGNSELPSYAIAAQFSSAAELYHAAEKVRDQGYRFWDVFSPFPIHGMDQAMGLGRSFLSKLVFLGGLTGALTGLGLTWIPSSILYPLIVQGKPVDFFSIPAYFPIIFELVILFSALTAVYGMLILNGLPRWHHPMFNWDRFSQVSADGFFLAIEVRDPTFDERRTRELLENAGAQHITMIHEDSDL